MFAQRKGKDFRSDLMKEWEKGGVKGASEIALEEMRESGMEAWVITKDATMSTEAWKKAHEKAEDVWGNLDDETKQVIQEKLDLGKKMAGKAKTKVKKEGKIWIGRAREEGKKLAKELRAEGEKKVAGVKKDVKKRAGKAVAKAKRKVKKVMKGK